ncbi:hypothetical protein AYK25_05675 [Thermoplasmatales archaeon SM1-50]|nr:MAG: hypothetical protein AYK25_05675 [Thermoplasmatales archaeon SM1-50]
MKKQLVIIGIVSFLVILGIFSGCDEQKVIEPKTEKEKFFGTWKNTTSCLTMVLSSDETCIFRIILEHGI